MTMGFVLRGLAAGVLAACVLCTVTPTWSDQAEGTDAYRSGDYARALAIWKPLAERGERGSQFCLGVLFHLGRGVEKNLAEAQKWYVLAGKRGHADARKQALALRRRMTQVDLADARRRFVAFGEGFKPHEVLASVFYSGGKETRRVLASDAEGRLGAAIIPLLVIHDDGICRWSVICESGTLTVSFASGPAAFELQ